MSLLKRASTLGLGFTLVSTVVSGHENGHLHSHGGELMTALHHPFGGVELWMALLGGGLLLSTCFLLRLRARSSQRK